MKLSTKIKKYVPEMVNGNHTLVPIEIFVDGRSNSRFRPFRTNDLNIADEYHNHLINDEGCTLLPLNECPVVSDENIIMHYASGTYEDWQNGIRKGEKVKWEEKDFINKIIPPTWEEYLWENDGELTNGEIIKMENEGKLRREPLFEETNDFEHIKTMKYEDFYIDFVIDRTWNGGEDYGAYIYRKRDGFKHFITGAPVKQQSFEYFLRLVELCIDEHIEDYFMSSEAIEDGLDRQLERLYNKESV